MNVAPHNVASPIGTVASAHVCASIPNFLVIEYHAHDVPWWAAHGRWRSANSEWLH